VLGLRLGLGLRVGEGDKELQNRLVEEELI
jgi:hypothetical protein